MSDRSGVVRIDAAGTVDEILSAAHLFDRTPRADWTADFLTRDGHHLLVARLDRFPVGFVTGIELLHPDKGLEMMLYELGVQKEFRRRGIGTALVRRLLSVSRDVGCRGMWVPIAAGDEVAMATYRAAGAEEPEEAATLWWPLE